MLTQAKVEELIATSLQDPEVIERYNAQDPLVLQQIRAIGLFLAYFSKEMDISEVEPFIKTRVRSILADATNKGILPIATPCQYTLQVINKSQNSISLTQGRQIEDNSGGRVWRLLQSVTVASGETGEVLVEQSEYREVSYTVPLTEIFHKYEIALQDDVYLANVSVVDDETPTANVYSLKTRWMNVAAGDYAFNLSTDSLKRIFIEFGDTDRAGITAQNGDVFTIGILETTGEIDVSKLKEASLLETLTTDEQKVSVKFKTGGLIRNGASPLTTSQLALLASYPALYTEDASFLANFDYAVRKKFMARAYFISVWNETVHEKYYGASWENINHLNLSFIAKESTEQTTMQSEIELLIATIDNLYDGNVNVKTTSEVEYSLIITGKLAAVHDVDTVASQIKTLLVENYGRTTLAASRWLVNGFNTQEISTLIRNNIAAFQDKISDFSLTPPTRTNSPHEWIYMTEDSISITLERTAENMGATWTLL